MGRVFGPTGNNASAKYSRSVRIPFNVRWWNDTKYSKMNPDKDVNDLDLLDYIIYSVEAGWVDFLNISTDAQNLLSRGTDNGLFVEEKDRVFADDTTVSPASAGAPTISEIEAFATAAGVTGVILYYTGNDTAGDPPTKVYHIDGSGNATALLV